MQFLNKAEILNFIQEHRGLFDAAGERNPFAGSAWMLEFIDHVAKDDWGFVVAHRQDDGESLLLLYQDPQAPHRCSGLVNHYVSLYSPLISSARDRGAALGRLVGEMAAGLADSAAFQFSPLDAHSPDTPALGRALSEQGWYVKRYINSGNWHLPCAGLSFQEYMSRRDSQLQHTWRRKSKPFFRQKGEGTARLEIVTGLSDTEAALAAYEKVYAKSWKKPESHPEFIRAWARTCARKGWLRLGLAWVGEVPVAAQFWFTLHGRAHIFKLAYDEDYARWSAGTVLTAHLFQHSLDQDQVTEIDYLSGDDAYKRTWMTCRRERVGLLACNLRTARGLMLAATELAGTAYERWRCLRRPGHRRETILLP